MPYYKDCAPVIAQPLLVAHTAQLPIAYYANIKGDDHIVPNKTRNQELLVELDRCAVAHDHVVYDLNQKNLKLVRGEIVLIDISILPAHIGVPVGHYSRLPGFQRLWAGHHGSCVDHTHGCLELYVEL